MHARQGRDQLRCASSLLVLLICASACSTDVFTGGDDGSVVDASDGGIEVLDGALVEDAPASFAVACGSSTCTEGQVCCGGIAWTSATCGAADAAGSPSCGAFLACDRASDCPSGTRCCAATTNAAGTSIISNAQCRTSCNGGTTELCGSSLDCPSSHTCVANTVTPGWTQTCQ